MPRVNLKTGKIIEEQKFKSSTPEKELQKYIETHINLFFQSHYLKSFYKIPGGEIDTLAITEDGKPCIIEYKHKIDDKIINQIVFYYDWLQERSTKYEFERIVKENELTADMEVDWSSVRLITVAKNYSKWDISLIKHLDTDIECFSYSYHKNELDVHLDPIINQYKKRNTGSSVSTGGSVKELTLDIHREKISKEFKPYFDNFRSEVLNLGENIEEGYAPEYIKYVVNTTFLAVHVRKQWLILQLRVDQKNFKDPHKLCKDISQRKWSVTRELKYEKTTDLDVVIHLIRQAYEYQM
jgi:predicted transport protein